MDIYLFENFVFEFEDKEMIEKSLILFAQQAENKVERKGIKKVTFNYYPQEKNGLQLVVEGEKTNNKIVVKNMKIHHVSPVVWKLKIINPFSNFNDCFIASQEDGSGFVIIRLVNEQVLGKIKSGDIIEAQVVGIAIAIDIFENEKEYEKNVPKSKDGIKYFMKDGTIIPINAPTTGISAVNPTKTPIVIA